MRCYCEATAAATSSWIAAPLDRWSMPRFVLQWPRSTVAGLWKQFCCGLYDPRRTYSKPEQRGGQRFSSSMLSNCNVACRRKRCACCIAQVACLPGSLCSAAVCIVLYWQHGCATGKGQWRCSVATIGVQGPSSQAGRTWVSLGGVLLVWGSSWLFWAFRSAGESGYRMKCNESTAYRRASRVSRGNRA